MGQEGWKANLKVQEGYGGPLLGLGKVGMPSRWSWMGRYAHPEVRESHPEVLEGSGHLLGGP